MWSTCKCTFAIILEKKNYRNKVIYNATLIFQQLRRQLASKQEKLSRLMRQHDKKITATHDANDQIKR